MSKNPTELENRDEYNKSAICCVSFVRLLKNICLWKDILAFQIMADLGVDQLLSGKVLPDVCSISLIIHDAITRTERVVASLNRYAVRFQCHKHNGPQIFLLPK